MLKFLGKVINNFFDYIFNMFLAIYDLVSQFLIELVDFILGLITEHTALTSVAVTFLIFAMSKQAELKLRKHESKRNKYDDFITYIVKFFSCMGDINNGNVDFFNQNKTEYFQLGANLAIYGSSRLYKEYCFLRMITTKDVLRKNKYFDDYLIIVSFAKMFKIIRKEVGLNNDLISIPKTLLFAINDITKPELMIRYYRNRYNRIMLKFIIIGSYVRSFHWPLSIYYLFIKPIVVIPILTIFLMILNLIIKPIGFIWNLLIGKKKLNK